MDPATAFFLLRLAPELRKALVELVRALMAKDPIGERRALEAARRAAFEARQRR